LSSGDCQCRIPIGKRRLRGQAGGLPDGGQLERCAQAIVFAHVPGCLETARIIRDDWPGIVVSPGGGRAVGVQDLALHRFAGQEAAAGDVRSAPGRVIGLIGADGGGDRGALAQSQEEEQRSAPGDKPMRRPSTLSKIIGVKCSFHQGLFAICS